MVARCYWGMSLQVFKRIVMVGCRSLWVANGAAVLLGNANPLRHGVIRECNWRFPWWRGVIGKCHYRFQCAVLSGNAIAGETQCNGGFQAVLGCWWWRCVISECHCRFPWWHGVIGECHCRFQCWCGVIGECHCRSQWWRGVVGEANCRRSNAL